ncbi:exonuclease domain-containing protein [Bacillus sp. REN16]|uniref:exonuclease domain-containing protein n=1 Tax=Bacillus sp. REN16 TaxID=2887296 RepID=UPI001E474B64|nr:exonuclease domain-containing protein [Bacillus sp. REN16]MCC3358138.1 3'-5' exoribonuclease [Bacillus sp. REN16]
MKDNLLFQFVKQFRGKISSNIYTPLIGKADPKHLAFLRNLEKELETEKSLYIPLHELNVVVFDFETTGFYPGRGDQILSIGAVKCKNGKMCDGETFYSLVHNNGILSPDIKTLTGLHESDLQAAPDLSEVLISFYQFVQSDTLVAHHASHEKQFLQHANWKAFKKPYQHRIVDTSLVFNIVVPDKNIVSLDDYCTLSGLGIRNRHHALGDAIMTAELWELYIKKLSNEGCCSLKDVYERIARL